MLFTEDNLILLAVSAGIVLVIADCDSIILLKWDAVSFQREDFIHVLKYANLSVCRGLG